MQRIFGFLYSHKQHVLFSFLVVISLTMMSMDEVSKTSFSRGVTVSIFRFGQSTFSWAIYMADLWRENRELREENLRLSMELSRLREAKLENIRLRSLLGFKSRGEFTYIPARVIARDGDRTPTGIVIDIGLNRRLKRGMAVVTSGGLVGRVFDVFPESSLVQLLLDRGCRVSAIVQNEERPFGIIRWDGGNKLILDNVPVLSRVNLGDVVVSSGMGGVFPKGIRIGVVSSLGREKRGLFREVEVTPGVNFSSLEEVFVLMPRGAEASGPVASKDPGD